MHTASRIVYGFAFLLLSANVALAGKTNTPVIIDANATAAYVKDGSSTNRLSPPVPGVRPLKSLRAPLDIVSSPTIISPAVAVPQPEVIKAGTRPTKPAANPDESPFATYRFIDKRPLGLNPAPVEQKSVYTLDDVPKSQQRNPVPEAPPINPTDLLVPLSPAR